MVTMRSVKEKMTPNRLAYLRALRDGTPSQPGGYGTAMKDCFIIDWSEPVMRLTDGRELTASQFYSERPVGGKRFDDFEKVVGMVLTEEGRRVLARN